MVVVSGAKFPLELLMSVMVGLANDREARAGRDDFRHSRNVHSLEFAVGSGLVGADTAGGDFRAEIIFAFDG